MLAVSGRILNSPRDLIVGGSKLSWGPLDESTWVLGDPTRARSVEAAMETIDLEPPDPIPAEYRASMEDIARGPVPWPLVIPQHVLGEHLRGISSGFDDTLEQLGDYAERLASSRRILSKLRPCRVDLASLRVEQGRSTTSILDSFEPGADSMCPPPVYSHATATGRLTVREGPRILTLQKNHRRILSSRFSGGRVMQVDFVSLEPRVLRLLSDGSAPIDIYSDVAAKLGGGSNRRQVKLATLKLLYGSSRAGITDEVGSISSQSIRRIEEYFGLPGLRARLTRELAGSGAIRSLWGRPLPEAKEQHLLVSHFTQSTAVDVALGGFGDLLTRIEGEDLNVVPCYVLHDALLLDVHPEEETRLREIVAEGLEIETVGHFEISLTPAYIEEG
jgi:hypothetical protein